MRKYSMEYYMMNDTTFYCPEWENIEMTDSMTPLDGSENESLIGKFFRGLFG